MQISIADLTAATSSMRTEMEDIWADMEDRAELMPDTAAAAASIRQESSPTGQRAASVGVDERGRGRTPPPGQRRRQPRLTR